MTFPRDVTLTAGVVAVVDVSAETRQSDVVEVRVQNGVATVWARGDGGTPAAFALESNCNWYDRADTASASRLHVQVTAADRTLRLLSENDTTVRLSRLSPMVDIRRLHNGFGLGTAAEYPIVSAGVTALVLSGNYGPGQTVRVDFPDGPADYAITADGSTPSASNGVGTAFEGLSHLIYLSRTLPPASCLKVYASPDAPTSHLRIQKVVDWGNRT